MSNKQYMMPISTEEYERQKNDYTQQALKDLQNHLEEHVNKKVNKQANKHVNKQGKKTSNTNYKTKKSTFENNQNNSDTEDDSYENNSVIEYTTDDQEDIIDNVNITINREPKKYKTRSNSKQTNHIATDIERYISPDDIERYINQTMVHEYEARISNYKNIIANIKNEINEENKKNHYLKLDLNNSICDNNDNKNKIMQLKSELLDKNKLITIQNDTLYKIKMHIIALKVIVYMQIIVIFLLWLF